MYDISKEMRGHSRTERQNEEPQMTTTFLDFDYGWICLSGRQYWDLWHLV